MEFKALYRSFETALADLDFSSTDFTALLTRIRETTGTAEIPLSPRQIGVLRALFNDAWQASLLSAGKTTPLLEDPEADEEHHG